MHYRKLFYVILVEVEKMALHLISMETNNNIQWDIYIDTSFQVYRMNSYSRQHK